MVAAIYMHSLGVWVGKTYIQHIEHHVELDHLLHGYVGKDVQFNM